MPLLSSVFFRVNRQRLKRLFHSYFIFKEEEEEDDEGKGGFPSESCFVIPWENVFAVYLCVVIVCLIDKKSVG